MALATHSRKGDRAGRRVEAQDRFLAAAERLFAAGMTFAEISVARLCEEAGLTRTTFYAYFADKADVLGAWFEAAAAAEPRLEVEEAPTRERLREALAAMLEGKAAHRGVMAAAYDASLFDATIRESFAAMLEAKTERLHAHIEAGQAGGWVDPALPPRETARWLTWMIERAGPDELDTLTSALWNTLYAPAGDG